MCSTRLDASIRPIAFNRALGGRSDGLPASPPLAPMHLPNWSDRVTRAHCETLKGDGSPINPMRRLVLLKRAVVETTNRITHELAATTNEENEDKLG